MVIISRTLEFTDVPVGIFKYDEITIHIMLTYREEMQT
jgi:hypothetical protein